MSFLTLVTQTSPNTSLGFGSLVNVIVPNATGNVAIGPGAGAQITTGDFNTALGNNALILNQTGNQNTAVGGSAMSGSVNAIDNVAVGYQALSQIGGNANTAIGAYAGSAISTGAKNSILGGYTGNQGGLDIRTLSNYIVLSDGDGNPRLWIDNTGAASIPGGITLSGGTANGVLYLNGSKVVSSDTGFTWDTTQLIVSRAGADINLTVRSTTSGTARLNLQGAGAGAAVLQSVQNGLFLTNGDANGWVFTNSGGEQMRLNSTGLGIGTTPSYKLDVSVGTNTIAQQWQGAGTSFTLRLKTGNGATPSSSVYRLYMDYLNGSNTGGYIDFYRGLAGNDGYLLFGTSGSDRMTLDASGNLGLGVTPSAWNTVVRALQFGPRGNLQSSAGTVAVGYNSLYDTVGNFKYVANDFALEYRQNNGVGSHAWFIAASGTAGNNITFTQAMTLDASGRLAIGVTSTTARLEVYQSANNLIRIGSAATSTAGISIAGNGNSHGTTAAEIYQDSGNNLNIFTVASQTTRFGTNNIERARIDGSGNFVVSAAALATTATDGFLYTASCAGVPTGAPTAYTGRIPMVVDTTNLRVYFNIGGTWRYATLT